MNRFALLICTAALSSAFAVDKSSGMPTQAATGSPAAQQTCGQVMASKAALPSKMAEVFTTIADNSEMHAKWMASSKDPNAKKERDTMVKIAKTHRDAAKNMTMASTDMMAMKDMQETPHDMKSMDPKMMEGMRKQIALTREMAQMMLKDAAEGEAMMKQMNTGHGGSGLQ